MQRRANAQSFIVGLLVLAMGALGIWALVGPLLHKPDVGQTGVSSVYSDRMPPGVQEDDPIIVGRFVVQAAFNIDQRRDNDRNSAVLRNASPALTRALVEKLQSGQRDSLFVSDPLWERMRKSGVTSWEPGYARVEKNTIDLRSGSGVITYDLAVTPVVKDSIRANPLQFRMALGMVRQDDGRWRANSINTA